MYWNNPIIEYRYPNTDLPDPVVASLHNGTHCLFYDPAVPLKQISNSLSLENLLQWINRTMVEYQDDLVNAIEKNRDRFANLVKLNLMLPSIKLFGNVKPFLLHYHGNLPFCTGTGDSRLKAFAFFPEIQSVAAFVSTHSRHREKFKHCHEITNIDEFAEYMNAPKNSDFLFRHTDSNAPYGLDWYEYVHPDTRRFTVPNSDYCVKAITNLIMNRRDKMEFSTEWLSIEQDWDSWYNYNK